MSIDEDLRLRVRMHQRNSVNKERGKVKGSEDLGDPATINSIKSFREVTEEGNRLGGRADKSSLLPGR